MNWSAESSGEAATAAAPADTAAPSIGDSGKRSVMAASGTATSVTVQLHPIVVMNISEHWTRLRAQQQGSAPHVLGALLGQQKGRNVEIMNSIELLCDTVGGHTVLDTDYYAMKEEQYKQVFPNMDLVGWYTSGGAPCQADVAIHQQVCRLSESALLMLKLDPLAAGDVESASGRIGELPVSVYESVIDLVDGAAQIFMVPTGYSLATEEAERIGVDHVARVSDAGSVSNSALAESMVPELGALQMLSHRVKIIARYVKAMHNGDVPLNYDILREASSISHCLPVVQSGKFSEELDTQISDVLLTVYLGAMTKGCDTSLKFINKFNTVYDKQAVGRRTRGMFL